MFGDQVDLVMEIEVFDKALLSVELVLRQENGVPVSFAASGLVQDMDLDVEPGQVIVRASLPPAWLAIGAYSIDLALTQSEVRGFDHVESGIRFHVDSAVTGQRNWAFSQNWGGGHALWDVRFQFLASASPLGRSEKSGRTSLVAEPR